MPLCAGREARYVPWSFGEIFECLTCGLRLRQDHRLQPMRGQGYAAVYPIQAHETRPRELCMPCTQGFHDICSRRRGLLRLCDCETCAAAEVPA